MPYQVDLDNPVRAALEVLTPVERHLVQQTINQIKQNRDSAKRLSGDPNLFLLPAGSRWRVLFSVNEPQERITVHDILNIEAIEAMHAGSQ
jgi:hypothetical protein